MRDTFVVYRSFRDAAGILSNEAFGKYMRAIFDYVLDDKEPELKGMAAALFTAVKPQLEANNKKYDSGKKGGRPKKETYGFDEKETYGYESKKPNVNVNVNDNVNVNVNDKKEINKEKSTAFQKPTLEEVTAYCLERKNGINPQAFIDFYESKGWMIGKNKMRNWRAAIRTWERTQEEGGKVNDSGGGHRPLPGVIEL